FDLSKESDEKLIERLGSANVYFRETAQRLLSERGAKEAKESLMKLVGDPKTPRKQRLHALWALLGSWALPDGFHQKLFTSDEVACRAWAYRAAGNQTALAADVFQSMCESLKGEKSPDVLLQAVIAARKIAPRVLKGGDDPTLEIDWQMHWFLKILDRA